MSASKLENYLPPHTLPFLKKWFGDYYIHIKITKGRNSKLGDYCKLPDGSHRITINSTLPPELFFFVLTHELAHLISFEKYGRKILPHGTEWKKTFRDMLIESIYIYKEELRAIILRFSKSPKANFMASPELVLYFKDRQADGKVFIREVEMGKKFVYKGEIYQLLEKLKINYLCVNLSSGKKYSFKPLSEIEKIQNNES